MSLETRYATPDPDLVATLLACGVASLADAVDELTGRTGFLPHDMKPLGKCKIAGPAATVSMRKYLATDRGDHPPVHLDVLDEACPGSVLVIGIEDGLDVAGIGGLMSNTARMRGLAGAVIDGAARDRDDIVALGFPVFARSVSPASFIGRRIACAKQAPVVCGGVTIRAGDYVVGDGDGVVVLPLEIAREAANRAADYETRERDMLASIRETGSMRAALARHGRY
jgi:4-hydroxy-4-methyl-2-oxoglutarate aldolase